MGNRTLRVCTTQSFTATHDTASSAAQVGGRRQQDNFLVVLAPLHPTPCLFVQRLTPAAKASRVGGRSGSISWNLESWRRTGANLLLPHWAAAHCRQFGADCCEPNPVSRVRTCTRQVSCTLTAAATARGVRIWFLRAWAFCSNMIYMYFVICSL